MNTGILELKLGEHGKDLIGRTSLKVRLGSVGGLTFYEVSDIATGTEPTVRLQHAGQTLELPQARSVMLAENTDKGWPIGRGTIQIKMPPAPRDASDSEAVAAYDAAVFALYQDSVRRIKQAGWKRYLYPDEPRIAGVETYRFKPGYGAISGAGALSRDPDPDYRLTLEDWLNLDTSPSPRWRWYLDDAWVSLSYSRSPRGAGYEISDKFEIEVRNGRSMLIVYDPGKNSDLKAGIEAYKAALPDLLDRRHKAEAKAKAAGIPILADYVDPPVGGVAIPAD